MCVYIYIYIYTCVYIHIRNTITHYIIYYYIVLHIPYYTLSCVWALGSCNGRKVCLARTQYGSSHLIQQALRAPACAPALGPFCARLDLKRLSRITVTMLCTSTAMKGVLVRGSGGLTSSHSSQDRDLNRLKQSCSKGSGLPEDSLLRPARILGSAAVLHLIRGSVRTHSSATVSPCVHVDV